jgi:hypothetical protein
MAERQGFEPWIPCGIHAFQACAFSHSAISPRRCWGSNFTTLAHRLGWAQATTQANPFITRLQILCPITHILYSDDAARRMCGCYGLLLAKTPSPNKVHDLKPVPIGHARRAPGLTSGDVTIALDSDTVSLDAEMFQHIPKRCRRFELQRPRLPIDLKCHHCRYRLAVSFHKAESMRAAWGYSRNGRLTALWHPIAGGFP